MNRLNVGSGQRPFAKPWINIDLQTQWNPDVVSDVRSMPMFKNNSADIIVLHHVLEHLGQEDDAACINECYRILAPGGSLIVTVPDMFALATRWVKGQISDFIFLSNTYGAYMGSELDRHRAGYTGRSLATALGAWAPWTAVRTFDWREIEAASIARDWWILGIEAIK